MVFYMASGIILVKLGIIPKFASVHCDDSGLRAWRGDDQRILIHSHDGNEGDREGERWDTVIRQW